MSTSNGIWSSQDTGVVLSTYVILSPGDLKFIGNAGAGLELHDFGRQIRSGASETDGPSGSGGIQCSRNNDCYTSEGASGIYWR